MSVTRLAFVLETADQRRVSHLQFFEPGAQPFGAADRCPLAADQARKRRGRRRPQPVVFETVAMDAAERLLADADANSDASTQPLRFHSGNPTVDVTDGILHVFKEDAKCAESGCSTLCMTAVPSTVLLADLLRFIAPLFGNIDQIRIVRDSAVSFCYMALLHFRSADAAQQFYAAYNGVPFSSAMATDVCRLVRVAKLEVLDERDAAFLPQRGLTELPNCPVCLERMDESVEGIVTVLCNHSFHASCLKQCVDNSCPVCRYEQTPSSVETSKCSDCELTTNLWICLICGYLGCGRHDNGHAFQHFVDTSHTYALQVGTNTVWDYVGDNYVHRLIGSSSAGKMVEYVQEGYGDADASAAHLDDTKGSDKLIEQLEQYFTLQMITQSDQQRKYFEDKIDTLEGDAACRLADVHSQLDDCRADNARLREESAEAGRQKQVLEKRCTLLGAKLERLSRDLDEERSLNAALRENQTAWRSKLDGLEQQLTARDGELADLKEQMRDLMFFLEARNTLHDTAGVSVDEVQSAQVVVPAAPSQARPNKSTRKKGK